MYKNLVGGKTYVAFRNVTLLESVVHCKKQLAIRLVGILSIYIDAKPRYLYGPGPSTSRSGHMLKGRDIGKG